MGACLGWAAAAAVVVCCCLLVWPFELKRPCT
jgi:hypothetical protein